MNSKERVRVGRRLDTKLRSFLHELLHEGGAKCPVLDKAGQACEVEGIFVALAWKRVDGIAPVPAQVLLFGRRNDERKDALGCQNRAHRMHSGTTVRSCRPQEAEADAVLVQQGLSGLAIGRVEGSQTLPKCSCPPRLPVQP